MYSTLDCMKYVSLMKPVSDLLLMLKTGYYCRLNAVLNGNILLGNPFLLSAKKGAKPMPRYSFQEGTKATCNL